jgi:hypothetical protein
VCDTYNGAVPLRPAAAEMSTLAFSCEPSGAVVAGADLVVVESAAHRLTRIPLGSAAVSVAGFARRTRRPVTKVAPGEIEIVVTFDPPPGQKLDDRFGPSSRLLVSATVCCTSPPRRRRATRTANTQRATCTSRTGVYPSGSSRAERGG